MSNFAFLAAEFPELHDSARRAETWRWVTQGQRRSTPGARWNSRSAGRTSTIRAQLPYQDNLSALIHEPSFKQAAGEAVFSKAG